MDPLSQPYPGHSRREILKSSALALLALAIPGANHALRDQQPMTANGGTFTNLHFKGRVARCSTFTGMGTDNQGNRIAFGSHTTDYGVMQGEYWSGSSSTARYLHAQMTDVVPGIGDPRQPDPRFSPAHCAVWTLLGRSCSRAWLTISSDGNTFTLEMQKVPLVDQPRWPALDSSATPLQMTFKMVWRSTGESEKYEDSSRHFRFTGTRASRQLEAEIDVPSIGFSWKSDPLNTSKCDFAIIGEELNGRYYDS